MKTNVGKYTHIENNLKREITAKNSNSMFYPFPLVWCMALTTIKSSYTSEYELGAPFTNTKYNAYFISLSSIILH